MQSIGQAKSPTSEENIEVLGTLSLDGTSGKVLAVIDERMLSFESKTGHLTCIRLNSILHTHHHNSRLAPFWVAFLGLMFVWFGYRIIDPMDFRIGAMAIGGIFIASWVFTGKPTLTIETEDNVCFAIMGNDARLMRMNHLIQRISQGMSLNEAREGLELLQRDTDYPGITGLEESFDLLPPVNIEAPTSIGEFLGTSEEESPMSMFDSDMFSSDDEQALQAEYVTEVEADSALPDWFTEPEVEMEVGLLPNFSADGLIQRATDNIETRRHYQQNHQHQDQQYNANQMPYQNQQNTPSSYQEQFGGQQNTPLSYQEQFGGQQNSQHVAPQEHYARNNQHSHNNYSPPQMHQMPSNQHQQPMVSQNQAAMTNTMHQEFNMPIAGDLPLRTAHENSHSNLKQEAGISQLPEPLPSFWNKEGAHIPSNEQEREDSAQMSTFSSPDSLPPSLSANGVSSVIANARNNREVTQPVFHQHNPPQQGSQQTMAEKFPNLKKRDSGLKNQSRLKIKSRTPYSSSRGIVGGLVKSSLSIGAKRATKVAQTATKVASNATRTLLGREAGYDISETTESLRVRSGHALQTEVSSSIQNLSVKQGGNLPQHEVDRLHQHISRSNSLIEQRAQNELESLAFGDLVDSETHTSSTSGKGGLARLD